MDDVDGCPDGAAALLCPAEVPGGLEGEPAGGDDAGPMELDEAGGPTAPDRRST